MITLKQFAVRSLVQDTVIADRIATFCDDNQLLGFINGPITYVEDYPDVFAERMGKLNAHVNIKKIELLETRLGVVVTYEYDSTRWYNKDESDWQWRESEKYCIKKINRDTSKATVMLEDMEEHGLIPHFE